MPEKYTRKHIGLALSLSLTSFLLDAFALHNAIYALFIGIYGWGFWDNFVVPDEPVFFIIGLIVVPAGLVAGLFGRVWKWAVVEPADRMDRKGVHLPARPFHFLPFSSYIWLWKYGKGIEAITEKRIRAALVFAAVLFLGIAGFFIVRRALYRYTD